MSTEQEKRGGCTACVKATAEPLTSPADRRFPRMDLLRPAIVGG